MTESLEVLPAPDKPLQLPPPDHSPDRSPDRPAAPRKPPVRRRRRWGRLAAWIVVLLLLAGGGYVAWRLLHRAPAGAGRDRNAPQTVGTAPVTTGDMQVIRTGLGTVTPLATVTVKTQINGQITDIGFKEGQIVHKGDFLFQIDPRPYQVALEQATGTLAKDQALLAQARADAARYNTLQKQDSIARQQVEDQQFLIKQYQGAVITDQAAIDSANLNLVYCHITSPVDGRVGIRNVDLGNYVQTSDTTGLVSVTQLTPMSVIFTLPEDDVAEVQKQMIATAGGLQTTAFDRTDTKQVATGKLDSLDTQIDSTTGTVRLRSLFPNEDGALFPQQFVNAHLLVETLKNVVIVPLPAVQTGNDGPFVYVVNGDAAKVQAIKTGVQDGNRVQVTDGLKPGETVVTDGLDRLRDGARVTVAEPGQPAGPGDAQRPGRGGRVQRQPGQQPAAPAGQQPGPAGQSGGSTAGGSTAGGSTGG